MDFNFTVTDFIERPNVQTNEIKILKKTNRIILNYEVWYGVTNYIERKRIDRKGKK